MVIRSSPTALKLFDSRIEEMIATLREFTAYQLTITYYQTFEKQKISKDGFSISRDINYNKRYQRIKKIIDILEAKRQIKFLREEQGRSPSKKRIYGVVK